ncbi:MAG: YlxR family protein [Actinobacteria bacterium]|nr:YlxR family protein [Actinomycetota bacterium]
MTAPIRTCVGCRSRREQAALTRYSRDVAGEVRASRTASGRGAWICTDSQNCLERAFSTRGFEPAGTPRPQSNEGLNAAWQQPRSK